MLPVSDGHVIPLAARINALFNGDVVEVSSPEILVISFVFRNDKLASVRHVPAVEIGNVPVVLIGYDCLCAACVVDDDPVVATAKAIKYADMIHLKDFYIRSNERMYPQNGMYVNFKDAPKEPNQPPRRPMTPEDWKNMIPRFGYVGTAAGNKILRGAIIGQGDMDMWKIISIIKNSGYEKEISLEFEGMEDCIAGTYYGLETAKYIWDRV